MSDTPVVSIPAIAVPGLKIAYQLQLPNGHALAYEAALPSDCSREDLDEMLYRLGAATRRFSARIDLPIRKAGLIQTINSIPVLERNLAEKRAQIAAYIELHSRNRSKPTPPPQHLVNELTGAIESLDKAKFNIEAEKAYVPYLEALVAGRDDVEEPFPDKKFQASKEQDVLRIEPVLDAAE